MFGLREAKVRMYIAHNCTVTLNTQTYNRQRWRLKATGHNYQQGLTPGLLAVSCNVTVPHVSCTVHLARYAWLRTALECHLQWTIVRSNHGRGICYTDWGIQSFHMALRPLLPFPTHSPSVTFYSTLNIISLTLYSPVVIWRITRLDTKQFYVLPTHLLTAWSTVLRKKLIDSQLVNKFKAFYGTRRFITTFTRARHPSLFSARSIQSTPPIPLPEYPS